MSTGMDSPHITLGSGPGSGLKIVPSFVSPVWDSTGELEAGLKAASVSLVPSGCWVGLAKAARLGVCRLP